MEQRPRPEQKRAQGDGNQRRCGHRNERAWAELEHQQFDGQQDGGERGAKDRGHACRCSSGQEGLTLLGRDVDDLTQPRAKGGPRGNDRPLCPERAAGADGNCRRQRLEEGHAPGDPAFVRQDLLHRFRDAVAPDRLGAIARHQTHDQRPCDRHRDNPKAKVIACGRGQITGKLPVKGKVGDQPYQIDQGAGDDGHHASNHKRHQHNCH